jgi:hypothetical protein
VPYAKHSKPTGQAQDTDLAKACWELSERIVKEKTGYESTI